MQMAAALPPPFVPSTPFLLPVCVLVVWVVVQHLQRAYQLTVYQKDTYNTSFADVAGGVVVVQHL